MNGGPHVTAADVQFLYRLLLGREPAPDETELQRTGATSWQHLVEIICTSDEYRAKRPSASPAPIIMAVPRVNHWHPDLVEYCHPVGTVSSDGAALVGAEGELFLISGTNSVLDQYRGETELGSDWADRWSEVLRVRAEDAVALGIALVTVIVPDKLALMPELFPSPLSAGDRPALKLVAAHPELLYPVEELRAAGRPCLRVDTHLTLAGNLALANAVLRRIGIPDRPERPARLHKMLISGDLGARFEPAIVEVTSHAGGWGAAELRSEYRKPLEAAGLFVGSQQMLTNANAPDSRRVAILGDSYGFASAHYQALGWCFAQVFAEVHMTWVPFGWDPELVAALGVDVVVSEGAERFVVRPPERRADVPAIVADARARAEIIASAVDPPSEPGSR